MRNEEMHIKEEEENDENSNILKNENENEKENEYFNQFISDYNPNEDNDSKSLLKSNDQNITPDEILKDIDNKGNCLTRLSKQIL